MRSATGSASPRRKSRRVFAAAQAHGLPVKLHADQLTNAGGAALAARFGALSADHLEYTDDAGAAAMAAAGTVAVLLPGAFYTLRETQLPPIDAFRRHGTAMALATDCNPGSSPLTSLLLAMNMGATLFRMTVEECILGGDAERGEGARPARRDRHHRGRQVLRSRDLERRAAGRAGLPHRVQPAPPPRLAGAVGSPPDATAARPCIPVRYLRNPFAFRKNGGRMARESSGVRMALRGTNQEFGRPYNRRIVLETIRLHAPITRADIARRVGLTTQTVANIVREIEEQGFIVASRAEPKGRGYPAATLAVNPEGGFAIGIHVTPLGLEAGLINLAGEVIGRAPARPAAGRSRHRVPRDRGDGGRALRAPPGRAGCSASAWRCPGRSASNR